MLPVLVMVAAFSRFLAAVMLPLAPVPPTVETVTSVRLRRDYYGAETAHWWSR